MAQPIMPTMNEAMKNEVMKAIGEDKPAWEKFDTYYSFYPRRAGCCAKLCGEIEFDVYNESETNAGHVLNHLGTGHLKVPCCHACSPFKYTIPTDDGTLEGEWAKRSCICPHGSEFHKLNEEGEKHMIMTDYIPDGCCGISGHAGYMMHDGPETLLHWVMRSLPSAGCCAGGCCGCGSCCAGGCCDECCDECCTCCKGCCKLPCCGGGCCGGCCSKCCGGTVKIQQTDDVFKQQRVSHMYDTMYFPVDKEIQRLQAQFVKDFKRQTSKETYGHAYPLFTGPMPESMGHMSAPEEADGVVDYSQIVSYCCDCPLYMVPCFYPCLKDNEDSTLCNTCFPCCGSLKYQTDFPSGSLNHERALHVQARIRGQKGEGATREEREALLAMLAVDTYHYGMSVLPTAQFLGGKPMSRDNADQVRSSNRFNVVTRMGDSEANQRHGLTRPSEQTMGELKAANRQEIAEMDRDWAEQNPELAKDIQNHTAVSTEPVSA